MFKQKKTKKNYQMYIKFKCSVSALYYRPGRELYCVGPVLYKEASQ